MSAERAATDAPRPRRSTLARVLLLAACLALGSTFAAPAIGATTGARLYDGEVGVVMGLAEAVTARTSGRLVSRSAFGNSSARFDDEWIFGTYYAAAIGFGQAALEHPELRSRMRQEMERCIDRLLDPRVRSFDSDGWHEDALASLSGPHGHAAYLGYTGLVLGLHRRVFPDSRFADVQERITTALRRRFRASPSGLIETYPGEAYAIDSISGRVAVAMADDAAGRPRSLPVLGPIERQIDSVTGLLYQAANVQTGEHLDAPRGSGTALAAHMLAFADLDASRRLDSALRRKLAHRVLGFGVVDEVPAGVDMRMDIDSGLVVFGAGVSATGFSLASARVFGDRERFERTYATAHLFGAPVGRDLELGFTSGGPLGDAILFAALTAPRESTLRGER